MIIKPSLFNRHIQRENARSGITKEEVCIKGRKGNEGRDAAIYLSRKYTRRTNEEIGKYFGGIRPSAVSLGSR